MSCHIMPCHVMSTSKNSAVRALYVVRRPTEDVAKDVGASKHLWRIKWTTRMCECTAFFAGWPILGRARVAATRKNEPETQGEIRGKLIACIGVYLVNGR